MNRVGKSINGLMSEKSSFFGSSLYVLQKKKVVFAVLLVVNTVFCDRLSEVEQWKTGAQENIVQTVQGESQELNIRDEFGWTPLGYAAWDGEKKVVEDLLAKGADPTVEIDEGAMYPSSRILRERGLLPIMCAAWQGHTDTVLAFLRGGAGADQRDSSGRTALMIGARKDQIDVIAALLANRTNVNARDEHGRTALMYAAAKGHTDSISLLAAAGGDVGAQDNYGWTALMYSACWGHSEAVENLLEAGADVQSQNKSGSTAAMIADRYDSPEIADLLKVTTGRECYDDKP